MNNSDNAGWCCPICGEQIKYILELVDDRYGYPGIFQLGICPNCGHKSVDAEFSDDSLASLYTDYYPRSSFTLDSFLPSTEVRGFRGWLSGAKRCAFRWVPPRVRVLDIGCGYGETLAYHKGRECEVYGVEADRNMQRVAERFGFNVHIGLFDPLVYEPEYFDFVTLDQVIEHVTDPCTAIKGIATVLKRGGVIILSTPNSSGWGARVFGRRWINWHAPYHLQHFSAKSMGLAAQQAGLVLERAINITDSEWLRYQWIHLLTSPRMGQVSSFWSRHGKRGRKEKIIVSLVSAFHQTRIDHLITRLFDRFGLGDNYVFFLRKP